MANDAANEDLTSQFRAYQKLNSPNYQKNFNTGGRMGYERIEDARVSTIRVFHEAKRPSRLMLPLAAARAPSP
jgi:hypothetical protein